MQLLQVEFESGLFVCGLTPTPPTSKRINKWQKTSELTTVAC